MSEKNPPPVHRKIKSVFEVAERRREEEKERSQTEVILGDSFQRWRALKQTKGLKTDALVAKFLLDRSVPEFSAVSVKTEESSLLQQRDTEQREDTQGEDISAETQVHPEAEGDTEQCSDTDGDGDHHNQPGGISSTRQELEPQYVSRGTCVQLPSLSPALTPHIKEEHNIKQEEDQLQVSVPEFSAVSVKTEESSLLQQRETEQREDAQGEDISAETQVHPETEGDTEQCSTTDGIEDWRAPLSCPPAHMDTGADGDHHNQEIRARSTTAQNSRWFPRSKSAPETRATVNNGDMSGTGEGAKSVQLPSLSPALTPHIKEEHNIKQEEDELQVSVPEFSAVSMKAEESSLLQQRETQGEDTQGEDMGAEIDVFLEAEGDMEHFSDTDSVEDWRAPFNCPPAHMDTGADGDHHNQETRARSTTAQNSHLSPRYKSAPETRATVNNGDMSGTGEGAESRKYKCSVCEERFESKTKLQIHMRIHTGEEPFSCSVCKKVFTLRCNLKAHLSVHTGEKPFSCSVCKKAFARKDHLGAHMRTHTGEKPFSCSVCKKPFAQKSSLKTHMRTHTGVQLPSLSPALTPHIKEEHNIKQEEDQLQVSVPEFSAVSVKTEESSLLQQRETEQREDTQGEDIKAETHGHFEDTQGEDVSAEIHVYLEAEGDTEHFSDMDSVEDWRPTFRCSPAHMDTGADGDHHNQEIRTRTVNNGDMSGTGERAKNRKHKCSVCKKRFESNYKLERHWRVHTGEEPFSCSVCKRTFAQQCNLKKHMSTHTGEKPFSCSVCKKTFAQQGNLKKHMHTHTGEEPFSCSVCKRRFAQQCNLKKHMSVHTGEKPFSCSVCKKTFARKSYLDAHMRTHTGEKPFRCSYCKNRYAQKSYLDSHMRTHTGEKLFSCSVCKKTFAQKSYLKPHMRTHTGEKPFSCSVCEKVFAVKSNLKTHMWAHHSHIEMDMANTQATAFQVGSFHAALPAPSVSGSH